MKLSLFLPLCRTITASHLPLQPQHWLAGKAVWRATLILVRCRFIFFLNLVCVFCSVSGQGTQRLWAQSFIIWNGVWNLSLSWRPVKVRPWWRLISCPCHNAGPASADPDTNTPHCPTALPQPSPSTRIQLHQPALLHWCARSAQHLPVRPCHVSGKSS